MNVNNDTTPEVPSMEKYAPKYTVDALFKKHLEMLESGLELRKMFNECAFYWQEQKLPLS